MPFDWNEIQSDWLYGLSFARAEIVKAFKQVEKRFGYLRELEEKVPRIGGAQISEKLGARFGKAHVAYFCGGRIELAAEEVKKAR